MLCIFVNTPPKAKDFFWGRGSFFVSHVYATKKEITIIIVICFYCEINFFFWGGLFVSLL